MKPKSRLNFFIQSPKIIAALGLLILLAGWLFWMADTSPAPPTDPAIAAVTPDLSTRSLTGGIGDWPTLPGLATFGNQVRLLSFDLPALRLSPGSLAEVTLFWQTQTAAVSYTVFLHLLDANNKLVTQADIPLAENTCAKVSRFSADMKVTCAALLLPDGLTEGQYQLAVGVYDASSGQRLTTAADESQLSLTTIEVHALAEALALTATPLPPCPITTPNGQTPPGEQPSPDHHGNGQIWTGLWPEGKVVFRPDGPGQIFPDGSLGMKWWWWRAVEGQLTIEGRRLDASAPPLRADIPEGYGANGFQAVALLFPAEGCWEVTGKVGEAELTFVTLVVKTPEDE